MGAPPPRMHGVTHVHGGPDPTLIAWEATDEGGGPGGGGGIQFDTSPQEGGFLVVTTTAGHLDLQTGASGSIRLNSGDDVSIIAADDATLESSQTSVLGGPGGVFIGSSSGEITIDSGTLIYLECGSGGVTIRLRQTTAKLEIRDLSNALLFRIDQDGSLHGKTGKSLVFDL